MKVSIRSSAIAALLLFSAQAAIAQPAPNAEEIFARHVAATGGRDAILKISSIKMIGTMLVTSMGLTAALEAFSAAPNRMTTRMTMPGIGEVATGFDGTTAWEVNPMQGARIKSDKETIAIQEEADFYGNLLFTKERYQSTETVGRADFGGESTWHVKSVLKSGRVVHEYFSVATGLRAGSQTTQDSPQGARDYTIVESEYKRFGPLKISTRREMTTGPTKMVSTITDVILSDTPVTAFALPDQIKALVRN